MGREVMIEQGLSDPSLTLEENPRAAAAALPSLCSSVTHSGFRTSTHSNTNFAGAFSAGRYDDNVPDIDLDFPRSIREDLILRTHQKWGCSVPR